MYLSLKTSNIFLSLYNSIELGSNVNSHVLGDQNNFVVTISSRVIAQPWCDAIGGGQNNFVSTMSSRVIVQPWCDANVGEPRDLACLHISSSSNSTYFSAYLFRISLTSVKSVKDAALRNHSFKSLQHKPVLKTFSHCSLSASKI